MTPDDLAKLAYRTPSLKSYLRGVVGHAMSGGMSKRFASEVKNYEESYYMEPKTLDLGVTLEDGGVYAGPLMLEVSSLQHVVEEHSTRSEEMCWALFTFSSHTLARHLDHIGHYDVATTVRQAVLPVVYGQASDTGVNVHDVFRALEGLQEAATRFDLAFYKNTHTLDTEAASCLTGLANLFRCLGYEVVASRLDAARQMVMIPW